MSLALLTVQGSSVTMIRFFPFCHRFDIGHRSHTNLSPSCAVCFLNTRATKYGSSSRRKSGPFIISIHFIDRSFLSSSTILSMIFTTPPITSRRLWGGMLVAIPTAIPEVPFYFVKDSDNSEGSTTGSFFLSHRVWIKSQLYFC